MNSQIVEKLALLWPARREQELALRVQYSVETAGECRIYTLHGMEEIV